jgi:membrane associated rhomboid family serine protease
MSTEDGSTPPHREPALNAPWPVLALIALLVATHGARLALHVDADRFALTSTDFLARRYLGLITHLFVHGGWAHVVMNSVFILAFGVPVARYFGAGARGAIAFLGFFLVCGVVAGAGYASLVDVLAGSARDPPWAMVGASGAASAFMGAAARIIQGRGRPGPIGGRVVVGMTAAWVGINAVLGLTGLTPGAAGMPVAWEAHIFGFIAGLALIEPFGWLAGVKGDHDIAL